MKTQHTVSRVGFSRRAVSSVLATALTASIGFAQGDAQGSDTPETDPSVAFALAVKAQVAKVEKSTAELNALRDAVGKERRALNDQLAKLQAELAKALDEQQSAKRELDSTSLDITKVTLENKRLDGQVGHVSNLMSQYSREFEARLHIAETGRYKDVLQTASLAADNSQLPQTAKNAAQLEVVKASIERLHDVLGGTHFQGRAVDANSLVSEGMFAMFGPAAIFRSADGRVIGTAETRLGSLEPTIIAFDDPKSREAAEQVLVNRAGSFPLDPTLGDAHKIAATQETLWEHIQKGGPVMIPIFGMAGIALLIAVYRWLSLMFVRRPSQKEVGRLLELVGERKIEDAEAKARTMKGPIGRMLAAATEHLRQPKELIEEVMYERVLKTKLSLNRMLPFIAICAASAPLLGLLGTVSGIINTFKQITLFGSSDVKALSGGISEALITTKFGLIVAIPSLLLHAYLSRKARNEVSKMETTAVAFMNQVGRASLGRDPSAKVAPEVAMANGQPEPDEIRAQVSQILSEMLGPIAANGRGGNGISESPAQAG